MDILLPILAICLLFVVRVSCSIPSINDGTWTNELEKANHDFNLDYHTRQWMEKCEENNGTEAIINIQESIVTLTQCVTSKINLSDLSDEIKAAIPKGTLDEVFVNYCNHFPEIKHCRKPVVEALKVCLSDQGRQDLEIVDNAIDAAVDFMCYKGGERIAIFLSENGTECFLSNSDDIFLCMNQTLPDFEAILMDIHSSNASLFDDHNCRLEHKMKSCVVDHLVKCPDPTAANVIEGLIDFMLKKTPCYKGGASSWYPSGSLTIILAVLISRWAFSF